jgi:hypothetical protein
MITFKNSPSWLLPVVISALISLAVGVTLGYQWHRQASAPESWLDGTVDLKGGRSTNPFQAFVYAIQMDYVIPQSEEEFQDVIKNNLVPLQEEGEEVPYRLHDVDHPFVLPITRRFAFHLGEAYAEADCGELVITGAARFERLRNSSRFSVHSTGMPLDFRIPSDPRCRTWLEEELSDLERERLADVTRERSPQHFHVVLVTEAYQAWLNRWYWHALWMLLTAAALAGAAYCYRRHKR